MVINISMLIRFQSLQSWDLTRTMRRNYPNLYVLVSFSKNFCVTIFGLVYSYETLVRISHSH